MFPASMSRNQLRCTWCLVGCKVTYIYDGIFSIQWNIVRWVKWYYWMWWICKIELLAMSSYTMIAISSTTYVFLQITQRHWLVFTFEIWDLHRLTLSLIHSYWYICTHTVYILYAFFSINWIDLIRYLFSVTRITLFVTRE